MVPNNPFAGYSIYGQPPVQQSCSNVKHIIRLIMQQFWILTHYGPQHL